MPKTLNNEPEVTDLLGTDLYWLWRAGANKKINGANLVAGLLTAATSAIAGKFGVDATITGLTGGVGKLDAFPTVGLVYGYFILIAINDQAMLYQYQNQAKSGTDVSPIDNPTKRWRRVL